MNLSQTIRRVESEIDQAITEGRSIAPESVAAILETMQVWAAQAADLENRLTLTEAERDKLRSLLNMPEGLQRPSIRFDNVVPIVGRIGGPAFEDGGAA